MLSMAPMPSLREVAVLRAVRLAGEGATFKIDGGDFTRCIVDRELSPSH